MDVKQRNAIAVTAGSGNVFADLGFANAGEELTKAQLAEYIRMVVAYRRLTQAAATRIVGLDQPKISALLNGRRVNFSTDRLMELPTALGQDVDITVRAKVGWKLAGLP